MERVVQVLGEGVASTTRKVVSTMPAFCPGESALSMAGEVAKRLVAPGPEVLLFGVAKCLLGGGGMASVPICILEIIIDSKPWKKD